MEIFTAFGLSASAGLNAYLPLLIVAVCAKLEIFTLQEPFDVMTNWWVIGVLAVLLIVEILVDKVPAADTVNDIINTIIRPAAGAILFAASANIVTDLSPVISVILGLLISGSVHAVKATARPVLTATTAGIANPVVSTIEDVVSGITSLVAILLPWLVLLIATAGIVLYLWWRLRHLERQAAP
ncbi:MAG: DUF4126 domain-containing protein [Anaerolineae bacterium]|nr:DUF4126 domain-containing protein [Anaerolineae bacterium]